MTSERTNGGPPKDAQEPRASTVHYWVEYRGNAIELRGGQLLIGRSAMCRLVLDDPLVSRQHAEFRVVGDAIYLFDLKSVNGVFVNGKRVDQKVEIRPGDRVLIGEQEMTLVARSFDKETKPHVPSRRRFIETLHASDVNAQMMAHSPNKDDGVGVTVVPASATPTGDHPTVEPKGLNPESRDELTFQGEALELLAGVADKVLALGRGEEAERILGAYMANLLDAARAGALVGPKTGDKAAVYAVKLAAVTSKGGWIDYAVTLFTTLKRPLPGMVVDDLYGLLRKVSGVNVAAIREYVAVLHSVQSRFGPAERFVVQRIEGLERLAALR